MRSFSNPRKCYVFSTRFFFYIRFLHFADNSSFVSCQELIYSIIRESMKAFCNNDFYFNAYSTAILSTMQVSFHSRGTIQFKFACETVAAFIESFMTTIKKCRNRNIGSIVKDLQSQFLKYETESSSRCTYPLLSHNYCKETLRDSSALTGKMLTGNSTSALLAKTSIAKPFTDIVAGIPTSISLLSDEYFHHLTNADCDDFIKKLRVYGMDLVFPISALVKVQCHLTM